MILDDKELWQNTLIHIEMNISSAAFKTWFKDTELLKNKNGEVVIGVPNKMVKDWMEQKYNKLILKSLRSFDNSIRTIKYRVSKDPSSLVKKPQKRAPCQISEQQLQLKDFFVNKKDNLNPRYTFETFVVGPFNQLAHAAAETVIKNPALTYNPLFIYGNTGYGKTHLIQAIGNEMKKLYSGIKVFYVSSEKFSVDYINAIKTGKANSFKDKYRQYDVLIMDDIQFIADKEKTQEELFHLFNAMYDNNKQIIFSSDKHPNFMPGFEERLKGRFNAGLTVEITKPDVESREIILREKAKHQNLSIPESIIKFIAQEVVGNIRDLEGVLNTLACKLQLEKKEITEKDVKEAIKHYLLPNKQISVKDVVKKVAEYYQINPEDIYKKTRRKEVVFPRQIIMYILREDFGISFPQIGEELGGRDHTTVIHSCEKISESLKKDPKTEEEVNRIRSILNS